MPDVVDAYLEHYGVKGMHWGQRKASSSSSGAPQKSRKELRALNKEARAKGKAQQKAELQKAKDAYDNEIHTARDNINKHAQAYNDAKKQYKQDKHTIGKVAAKQILKKHEEKYVNTFNTAILQTTKEAHANMIVGVGLMAAAAIVPVAAGAARSSW